MASASEVRAQLSHPIIDCDGHIREFMPGVHAVSARDARSGEVRFVPGDGVGVGQQLQRRRDLAPHAYPCTSRRMVGVAVAQHARSHDGAKPAAVVRPARRARHGLRDPLPHARVRDVRHRGRRDAPWADPWLQHVLRRRLRALSRSHDGRWADPDADARGGARRARLLRIGRLEGDHDPPRRDSADPRAGARRDVAVPLAGSASLVRHVRSRLRVRLRPGVAPLRGTRLRGDRARRHGPADRRVHLDHELHLQPHGFVHVDDVPVGEVDLPRRRHGAISTTAVRVPRVRRLVGVHDAARHGRALGEAQPRRHRMDQPRQPRSRRSCSD